MVLFKNASPEMRACLEKIIADAPFGFAYQHCPGQTEILPTTKAGQRKNGTFLIADEVDMVGVKHEHYSFGYYKDGKLFPAVWVFGCNLRTELLEELGPIGAAEEFIMRLSGKFKTHLRDVAHGQL